MSLNKAMIIGNLGRDPEMRYTPSGQAVTQFTVAVNRSYKDREGNWQEETEWFRVVAWGPTGERAAEQLRKGGKVYVEGRMQTRQWEGQDGQKRYTTELIADQVKNLERRPREEDSTGEGASFPGGVPGGAPSGGPGGAGGSPGGGPARSGGRVPAPADRPDRPDSLDDTDLDDLPF